MIDSLYSDLPPEILINIFQHLHFYDLQSVSLVCKNWFAVTRLPEFHSKGVFKIISCLLNEKHPAAEVIRSKAVEQLYLKSVDFGDADELFRHIGISLKALTLKTLCITDALRLTFDYLPNLQSLKVWQIRVLHMIKDLENLPIRGFTQVKELELISNAKDVNKYLLLCSQQAHALESLTVEMTHYEEADVLRVLDKHSGSLKRVDLRFFGFLSVMETVQWSTVLSKLNLNKLVLQGNICAEILVGAIETQRSLRSLDVSGSVAVDDNYLALIVQKLSTLERLILANCGRITDQGINCLGDLPKLKTLDISCCNRITSLSMHCISSNPPKCTLRELHLQEIDIDEVTLCFCANNLPNLRVLNLSGCGQAVTNNSVQEIFDCQRKLYDLRLDNCNKLTDDGILGLKTGTSIQYLQNLQKLSLQGCNQLTDVTLRSGLRFPQLKFLNIRFCYAMTSRGLEGLVRNCTTIEEICITRSKEMSNEAVHTLTTGLGRLRTLKVNNCSNISQILDPPWSQSALRTFTNEVTLKRSGNRH